ncbi:MAG: phage portal protein [Clostridia bacterium]
MIEEKDVLKYRMKINAPISDEEFFAKEILHWQNSKQRKDMLVGKDYYFGNHKILRRKRTAIGKNGELEEVRNLPNNNIVDNRFAKLVDQKKNYLLGKPLTLWSENNSFVKEVKKIIGAEFSKCLKLAGEESLIGGIAWLYPYINEKGKLKFKIFPSYEICPFWKDAAHTKLDCAARVYNIEEYCGMNKKLVTRVELFKKDGMTSYELNGSRLEKCDNQKAYIQKGETQYNWQEVPLIAIKSNAKEIPLINKVVHLQDALNTVMSDFANNMEENVRNTILVLKNYDGTDLGEFRKNLSSYGAIKIRTVDGTSGGVELLNIEVNSENYKTIIELLSSAITQNARGFDWGENKLSSNINQLNIRSMYSDIDLDANDMETELQASLQEVMDFVKMYLLGVKGMNFEDDEIEFIFNRDILINETEVIENCVKSQEFLSKETLIAQHPWVVDPIKELEKLEKQNTKEEK